MESDKISRMKTIYVACGAVMSALPRLPVAGRYALISGIRRNRPQAKRSKHYRNIEQWTSEMHVWWNFSVNPTFCYFSLSNSLLPAALCFWTNSLLPAVLCFLSQFTVTHCLVLLKNSLFVLRCNNSSFTSTWYLVLLLYMVSSYQYTCNY